MVPSYDYEYGNDAYDIKQSGIAPSDGQSTDFGSALDNYVSDNEPSLYELMQLDKSDIMKNVFKQYFYY